MERIMPSVTASIGIVTKGIDTSSWRWTREVCTLSGLYSGRSLSKIRTNSMELRHLRCFLAVAEELHFARAAERLHIEQSPLSRAIKELEEDLGVQLFIRTTRSTRLSPAGQMFLEHVPRVFASLHQARDSVKAAANGFHGHLGHPAVRPKRRVGWGGRCAVRAAGGRQDLSGAGARLAIRIR